MTPGQRVYESFASYPAAITAWPSIVPWAELSADERAAWERAAEAAR